MKRSSIVFMVMLLLIGVGVLGLSGTVVAQRPGRATPIATVDRSNAGANRTPIATPDPAQPTRQRPNEASGSLTRTPLALATFNLPVINLTLTPRGTFAFAGQSDEAEQVINSFAATHLGTSYDFLYAGAITGDATLEQWDAYVAALPSEVQGYIATFASAAGGSYWGVFSSGMGMTAIGDCTDNPNCTISMDNLNVYLTSASAGIYAVYLPSTAANSSEALNLIYTAYPALVSVPLEAVSAESGYVFQSVGYDTGVNGQQVTASTRIYAVGVVSAGTQSLVYASVGVGDGYVGKMN